MAASAMPTRITNGMKLDPKGFYQKLLPFSQIVCLMPLYSASRGKNRLHLIYMVVVWAWVLLHLVSQIIDLVVNFNNISRVAQNLAFSICLLNDVNRAMTILLRWDSVHRIVLGGQTLFRRESENPGKEKATIRAWEGIADLWFRFYGGVGLFTMLLFIFSPLVVRLVLGPPPPGPDGYDPLPAKAWYPFDERSPVGYAVAYVFQAPPVLMGAAMLVAADSFCIRVVALTCGQLHLIRHEIKHVRDSATAIVKERLAKMAEALQQPKLKPTEEEIQQEMEGELRRCAMRHGRVLNFISDIERAMSPITLANSRVLTVCLVTTSFEIMNSEVLTIPRLVAIGLYFNTAIGFVLMYCVIGDLLINEQEKIHGELYETPWLEATLSYKKTMCFMGERSRIPMKISVGKIATLNLEFYVSEMNRAFSVFNAMLQIRRIEQKNAKKAALP